MKYRTYLIICTGVDYYGYIAYCHTKPKIQEYESMTELSNQVDEFIQQIADCGIDAEYIQGLEKFEIKFNPKFPIPEIER